MCHGGGTSEYTLSAGTEIASRLAPAFGSGEPSCNGSCFLAPTLPCARARPERPRAAWQAEGNPPAVPRGSEKVLQNPAGEFEWPEVGAAQTALEGYFGCAGPSSSP
eukprot:9144338-Pyramimonas_sp.AAC.2